MESLGAHVSDYIYTVAVLDSFIVWIPLLFGFLYCLDSFIVWVPKRSQLLKVRYRHLVNGLRVTVSTHVCDCEYTYG